MKQVNNANRNGQIPKGVTGKQGKWKWGNRNGEIEMGKWKWANGNGQTEMGKPKWANGNGQTEMGK